MKILIFPFANAPHLWIFQGGVAGPPLDLSRGANAPPWIFQGGGHFYFKGGQCHPLEGRGGGRPQQYAAAAPILRSSRHQ